MNLHEQIDKTLDTLELKLDKLIKSEFYDIWFEFNRTYKCENKEFSLNIQIFPNGQPNKKLEYHMYNTDNKVVMDDIVETFGGRWVEKNGSVYYYFNEYNFKNIELISSLIFPLVDSLKR